MYDRFTNDRFTHFLQLISGDTHFPCWDYVFDLKSGRNDDIDEVFKAYLDERIELRDVAVHLYVFHRMRPYCDFSESSYLGIDEITEFIKPFCEAEKKACDAGTRFSVTDWTYDRYYVEIFKEMDIEYMREEPDEAV